MNYVSHCPRVFQSMSRKGISCQWNETDASHKLTTQYILMRVRVVRLE